MLHKKLLDPKSIVVVGGSNNVHTPGGSVLKNLIDHGYSGELYAVNPKETSVQGIKCYQDINEIPETDTAIIAIAARFTLETVKVLCRKKNTQGFIIFSSGFSELDANGVLLEDQITAEINSVGGNLLGPNNIGMINQNYTGVFTSPIPEVHPNGVDFISGSGATAVFIMEAAMAVGLSFSSLYTVGNSAQIGIEEVLEHLDQTFDPIKSSKIILLYIESVQNPDKLLKNARSLLAKGCRIAAIKAGSSAEGSRAASSHTGALASSDAAVDALFKKAGIIRCHGRNELISVASVLMYKPLKGKNIAIITHAGGPAVMLTDTLSKNGFQVPEIKGKYANELLEKLHSGSSVSNPIDFLATGNAEQLDTIIDYCEHKFEEIDAMVVIFGSPGLFNVSEVYKVLSKRIRNCSKPIYPVLPSIQNAKEEIAEFLKKGHSNFPDEVIFGNALAKVCNTTAKVLSDLGNTQVIDYQKIRSIIDAAGNGYLKPGLVRELLNAVQIPTVEEMVCDSLSACFDFIKRTGSPLVMKAVGPIHKSDVGGIILDIDSEEKMTASFNQIMQIENVDAVLLQPMKKGIELFVGAKKEDKFKHLILFGMGGVYIEILQDVQTLLAPVTKEEANELIPDLKMYPMLKGIRNQKGINIDEFASVVANISQLVMAAPEISELDLNPLLGNPKELNCVDARIKIEK